MNDSGPRSVAYEFGSFRLEPQHRVLAHADGRRIEIAAKAFDALLYLVEHAGMVVPRDELMKALWPRTIVEDNNLNKLIAALRRALGEDECIVTLPGRGYQFVADVRVSSPYVEPALPQVSELAVESPAPREWRWQWIAVTVLGVTLAAVGAWNLKPAPPSPAETRPGVVRFQVDVVPGHRLYGGVPLENFVPVGFQRPSRPSFALSPDGQYLVYAATDGETQRLYKRRMDEQESASIPGTEGGTQPAFSPDSQFVAFFAGDDLKRVPIEGGEVRTIAMSGPAPIPDSTVSWTENDTLLVTAGGSIYELPADGGEGIRLTQLDENEFMHRYAQMLPNRRGLLLNVISLDETTTPSEWDIVVEPLDGSPRKVVVDGGSRPVYLPSGHIVFARRGQLWAVPFDATRLEAMGAPVVIVENVMHADRALNGLVNSGAAQFGVSGTGSLAYVPGGIYPKAANSLVWLDGDDVTEPLPLPPDRYLWPRFSPDGTKLVFGVGTFGELRLWVYDIALAIQQPLTPANGAHYAAVWSPDGERIAFSRVFGTDTGLFSVAPDGSGHIQRMATLDGIVGVQASSWSVDNQLAFFGTQQAPGKDAPGGIWTLKTDGTSQPERFGPTESVPMAPDFSPDGKWIAYASSERTPTGDYGRPEVYVRPFPDTGPEYRITSDGGNSPMWSRDGRQLFYMSPPGTNVGWRVMAVDVTTDPTFTRGKPRPLFEGSYVSCQPVRCYDISPDSKQFVAVQEGQVEPQPATGINIVVNWFEELRERMPVQSND